MFLLGEFDILDQIGDAYIRAIYCYGNPASIDNVFTDGNNGDANNASDPVGYGKRYQLPRGVDPKNRSHTWKSISYIRENKLFGYIDHVHFLDKRGVIHWDPNNPIKYTIDHNMYDFMRLHTPFPENPLKYIKKFRK